MKKNTLTLLLGSFVLFMQISCNQMNKSNNDMGENPFFQRFDPPRFLPPFDRIRLEHYKPAFLRGMEQQNEEIAKIIDNSEPPTFENTVAALDRTGETLNRVAGVFYAMTGAMSNEDIQSLESEISPLTTEHGDNIFLNEKLFERIKTVFDNSAAENLSTEQQMLLQKFYKDFIRSGITLDDAKKTRLRELNKELSLLTIKFGDNLLAETYNFQLVIDKPDDMAGLPNDAIEAAAETARKKGLDGKWVFTLSKPSWEPFLQYAHNRAMRELIYKAMYNRGNNGNEFDNKEIVRKIVNLRLEKAQLLGYKSYSEYRLEQTMAKNPEAAVKLLTDIWQYALPQAKTEREELQKLIKREGENFRLEPWDWFYYAEKLRKEKYDLDEAEARPYFQMEKVRDGAFEVANRLYGLRFKEVKGVPVYHPEVRIFEVSEADNTHIGYIYFDYFPRPEKRNGAWMGNFTEQSEADNRFVHPVVYNVGNFAPPSADVPSLLTIDQVETLFHEFGHALHGLLSKCHYESLSGTNVFRDFVELPSQINEHWAFHPEVLKMYAKHWQTGEVIPDELIEKIQRASKFNQGFMTVELVAAALLDLKWHSIEQPCTGNILSFEKRAMDEIGLISEIIPRYRTTYFSHIFDGGYAAGYYSYLWSEVLDADAFNAFETNGIFDPETAASFRNNVLSKGGSDEPMKLYLQFRGKEPNPDYLLINRGFK